jgi:DNA repair exonuclease SbcCD nuclease subunit
VLHCADLHLDRTFGISRYERALTRRRDLTNNFEEIVQYALKNRPDLFLICGDVYDRVLPTNPVRVFLTGKIRELKEAGIEVFVIGGNHDVPKTYRHAELAIDTLGRAGLATVFSASDRLQSRILKIEGDDICISGKSYNPLNETVNPIKGVKVPTQGRYNILMLHAAFLGLGVTPSVPSFVSQNPVTARSVPRKLNYLALGHFHNFFERRTRSTFICNPGSIERLSWLEENDEKAFAWTELHGDDISSEKVPLETRPMDTLEITVSKESGDIGGVLKTFFLEHGDPEMIVRLIMKGEITQEQNRALNVREVYQESRRHFFHFVLNRAELDVEGYGRIFMSKIENPVQAYIKRLDELMSRTGEEDEQAFLSEVKDTGRRYLEENA